MGNKGPSRKIVIPLALLSSIITLVIYIPALSNDFVRWDDHAYVYENPDIRSVDLSFLKWVLTAVVNSNWHPLTMFSYAVDYHFWGLDPAGYHLTSVLLHSANTFLVFVLAVRLSELAGMEGLLKPLALGLITALLFGLHPLHVESVAWVSERKDVISAFFFILATLSYLRYAASRKRALFFFSILFFVLALMSKPMAVTLPFVLLVLDFYPLGRLRRETFFALLKEKAPFLALAALSAAVTLWAQRKGGAVAPLEVSPLAERISIAFRGYLFYLKKMFYPADLAPFYVRPFKEELFDSGFVISVIVFTAASALAFISRRKVFLAAWLYYVITLLPVVGLVQVSDHAAADRYFYLPSIGLFLLIAGVTASFLKRKWALLPAGFVWSLVFIALSVLTIGQTSVWKDTVSLWTREIEAFPTAEAYAKRAEAYLRRGDFPEAARDYTVAITNTDEGLDVLYLRRGLAYLEGGNPEAALKDLTSSVLLNPKNASAYNNRGNALRRLGRFNEAQEDYGKALELSPGNASIYFNMGAAYLEAGDKGNASLYLEKASSLGVEEAGELLLRLP